MFDEFFKPKFYKKCKSSIRLTETRLENVRRKKNAVCKYLKNDIADLLKNGLDYNAYGRTEGLLDEKKRLSCYDFIERHYGCVGSNVSLLQKTGECPEECREAISSLIYAAARISEVPELRDLRSLFTERYGNSLEPFVDQEFVEKFKVQPPSEETKLQLLHDIAQEFSIKWDSKSFEQKLYRPPPAELSEDNHMSANAIIDEGHKRHELKNDTFEHRFAQERDEVNFMAKENGTGDKNKFIYSSSEDESVKTRESSERDSLPASSSSIGSISEDETDSKKPFYYRFIPAPYTKQRVDKDESIPEEKPKPKINYDQEDGSSVEAKPKPRSVRKRSAKPPPDNAETKQEEMRQSAGFTLTDDKREDEDSHYPLKPPHSRQAASQNDSIDQSELMDNSLSGEGTTKHVQSGSWQPEVLSNQTHHPNLPDYDELAARVAALRRR